jgi:hypothetical protein
MTTIAAKFSTGEIAADSMVSGDDESSIIPAKIKNDFWSIGTGANFAIAAMHFGASPKEAVEIACLYDSSSHGPIDEIKLPRKPRGVKKSL